MRDLGDTIQLMWCPTISMLASIGGLIKIKYGKKKRSIGSMSLGELALRTGSKGRGGAGKRRENLHKERVEKEKSQIEVETIDTTTKEAYINT